MQKQNKKIERGNNESNTIYERLQRVCNLLKFGGYLLNRDISWQTHHNKQLRKGQLMNVYEVTARKGRYLRTLRFSDRNDIEAMFSAMFRVLNKAKRYQGTWATGQIVLRNVSTNTIIAQMGEKWGK